MAMSSACCGRQRLGALYEYESTRVRELRVVLPGLRTRGGERAPRAATHTRSCTAIRDGSNVRPQWRHGSSSVAGAVGEGDVGVVASLVGNGRGDGESGGESDAGGSGEDAPVMMERLRLTGLLRQRFS